LLAMTQVELRLRSNGQNGAMIQRDGAPSVAGSTFCS